MCMLYYMSVSARIWPCPCLFLHRFTPRRWSTWHDCHQWHWWKWNKYQSSSALQTGHYLCILLWSGKHDTLMSINQLCVWICVWWLSDSVCEHKCIQCLYWTVTELVFVVLLIHRCSERGKYIMIWVCTCSMDECCFPLQSLSMCKLLSTLF